MYPYVYIKHTCLYMCIFENWTLLKLDNKNIKKDFDFHINKLLFLVQKMRTPEV